MLFATIPASVSTLKLLSRLTNPYSKWEQVCSFHFKKKYIKKPAIEIHAGFFDICAGQKLKLVPPKIDFPNQVEITHIYDAFDDVFVCEVNFEKNVKFYEDLDGMYGLAKRGEVKQKVPSMKYDFTGWELVDNATKESYSIKNCELMPTQVLLQVTSAQNREILVPVHEDFIIDIKPDGDMLTCEFPFNIEDL